ncbi:MAG: depupylase/deamidase Dop [Ferrimicrobium sp.]|jgi:proteasome accessory factor A|uniref:Depupylase/deamidase Dop n=1 Tax=Ferrimicrobium acidiphilum TaxID=121039 RepID=A0ABV3Y0U1_9ACTN
MPIPKVLGIETEYGVVVAGAPEANPISTSSTLINAYVAGLADRVEWDFVDESPGVDARGFAIDGGSGIELDTHLVNAVLTNGARLYVDHAHPEYSSPECISPSQALLYDKAGEEVMVRAMASARRLLPAGQEIVVYKNNSDRKGNSYGCHENYLVDREVPFQQLVKELVPFFVTRQVIIGAGKVGSEFSGSKATDVDFQLSQRADFFEEEVGLETTLKRPIINTRDEPHSDGQRFRRLHVILGDANLSERSTWLKLGLTAIVLAMIEDGFLQDLKIELADPVGALREISWDPTLQRSVLLQDGRRIRALEVQYAYLEHALEYVEHFGVSYLGNETDGPALLEEWGRVLQALDDDPMTLADTLDWVAKWQLVRGYQERHQIEVGDPRLAAIDLQYHDLRPERSLFRRLPMRRMLDETTVSWATSNPPPDTRAYFRGTCLAKFPGSIAAANWDSIIFDLGTDPLRRVPMMDPLRGTEAHVGELLRRVHSAQELVEALGS